MAENPKKEPASSPQQTEVSFWEAFRYWLKLGFISFGGPAGQIAIMHRDLVERRRWISEERFLHALNYCMLLPGPEAQQLAIYIGWLMHRTVGGIVAGAFFVIPSIFILLALSYTYAAYGNLPAVSGVLSGFKPVVVAIVVEAMLKIGSRALKGWAHYIIAITAFVAIYFLRLPFPLIVLAAGLIGLIGARTLPALFTPQRKSTDGKQGAVAEGQMGESTDTVIRDDVPPPAHTLPSWPRTIRVVLAGIVLWLAPIAALIALRSSASLHVQEYLFFSKAAYVTFGGAYAVLAYVTQAAVNSYGWVTHTQAVDGLALAETTPGPLIMVLQFIGFMAAWNNPGAMSQTSSGVLGALIATYTTFSPCFIYIFIGGPYVEVLRGNRHLTAGLQGITAAVVGVVLNLAVIFGLTVIWPQGLSGSTNWFAVVLTVAAFIALYRFKLDVLWVVVSGGLIGLAYTLLR
jgi:chromate transporter